MDFSEEGPETWDTMRSPLRAKHINNSMFIKDLVRWRQWRHYSITIKNSDIMFISQYLLDYRYYYMMILFKQFYWLSCCHLTFRKIWYCLIKTRIDLVLLSFSNEIYKKNHVNSISIRPMDIKVMWNFVQSESSY